MEFISEEPLLQTLCGIHSQSDFDISTFLYRSIRQGNYFRTFYEPADG